MASDARDPSFIIFPTNTPDETGLNIADWARKAIEELIDDYWHAQTKLENETLHKVVCETEKSFPGFSFSAKTDVIVNKPVLNGIMATTTFILYPDKTIDIDKLVKHTLNFHKGKKKGSTEYRRKEMMSSYINYTDNGSVNVFGPKTFDELHVILAVFLTDLAEAAKTVLKQEKVSLHTLEIPNTVITNKQEGVIFNIETIRQQLIKMELRHSVWNSAITVKPYPITFPKCSLKIFESGSISCLGTAPRSIKSLMYHFIDQLISKNNAYEIKPSLESRPTKKHKKNKVKHEKNMMSLLIIKKESYVEYEDLLPE